jgi:ethanolamine ammonia-lyase large subunit
MSNEELITVGSKIFNPLAGSNIGAMGYLSARMQPNSTTDNPDEILWQVFDAWSYTVGDLMLGTNPVSSIKSSVKTVEDVLKDVIKSFDLEKHLPWSVLAHIDIQSEIESNDSGSTALWFQSIAGTITANQVFGVSTEKMLKYAREKKGKFGLYLETGQGADFTNGQSHGVDMGSLESRKYGFAKVLQNTLPSFDENQKPWLPVNDVAGFIGPEVFRTKEQLVRVALEDTLMGKLHGLTIGLDICSTFHMSVSPKDIEWAIEQVMPINPAYLMALPTKQDPMLSYLTTGIQDHLRIRKKFGYKINEPMSDFFRKLGILDSQGKSTEHFGDPVYVYTKYRQAKGDLRNFDIIYAEGQIQARAVQSRGVFLISEKGLLDYQPTTMIEKQIEDLYASAKKSLYAELSPAFLKQLDNITELYSLSQNRDDYILHPTNGEYLTKESIAKIAELRKLQTPESALSSEIQLVVSDGLNANSLTDDGHLLPFLKELRSSLNSSGFKVVKNLIVVHNGRVRVGYQISQLLFASPINNSTTEELKTLVHIIGERPGTEHNNFSVYITTANSKDWGTKGKIDHDITQVVSGISDTALTPVKGAAQTFDYIRSQRANFLDQLLGLNKK